MSIASVNRPQYHDYSTLFEKCVGCFKCPNSMSRDQISYLTSLSMDGKRRSPKVQPSTRLGIEPRTFWLAVRDFTNCASLTHTAPTSHTLSVCLSLFLFLSKERLLSPSDSVCVYLSVCLSPTHSLCCSICLCLSVSHSLSLPCLSVWLSICFLFTLSFSLFDNVFNDRVARLCNNLHEETSY